jgi:hypothetical protein
MSKTGRQEAEITETRPIMILSHLTKIIEKVIKNKLEKIQSKFLITDDYQSGFKAEVST